MARDTMIAYRVNEQEKKAIDALASSYGLSRSEIIRQLINRELIDQTNYVYLMSKRSEKDRIEEASRFMRIVA